MNRVKMEERDLSKKKKMEERGQIVDLPPEIIHDIVSRLPVKALCCFKLVSKQWLSLITDPDFVAKYNKAIENKDVFFSRRRLLFTVFGSPNRLYSLDLDQFLNENRNVSRDHHLVATPTELDFFREVPNLHSSCNGLFLSGGELTNRWDIYSYSLNNSVTKESKKLPNPPTWRLPMEPVRRDLYGLGFDYSTDEYKVINGQTYKDGLVFSVYTLQTDSWRQINYLYPYMNELSSDGILVNSALHWLARKLSDESLVIISFLLAKEEVREIALPPNVPVPLCTRLGAFRNSLCIESVKGLADEELWVMKEYGVSESWTIMQVSIPYLGRLQHSGFWTKSYDLMVIHRRLVMYNFNDGTFWTLSIGDDIVKHGSFGGFGIYLESLLPSLIDQEQHAGQDPKEDEYTH